MEMTSPSKVVLTLKQNEECFAFSCFQHIMKSNMALNVDTRRIIMDMAATEVIKGKMSEEFFNSLFPNDAN
jgi:hypothetical protein